MQNRDTSVQRSAPKWWKGFIRSFIDVNIRLSKATDQWITSLDDTIVWRRFAERIAAGDSVADVGGGKQPAREKLPFPDVELERYDGFDIEATELELARDKYTSIHVADITQMDEQSASQYDWVICLSTLEHVLDDRAALEGLARIMKPEARLYIRVPYRGAVFAVTNRILPNNLKRWLLYSIFPSKKGDGFPAYYRGCAVSMMVENGRAVGLNQVPGEVNKVYTSTYFMFFFPLYLVWRIVTAVQYSLDRDYCERFEIVFEKSG